MFPVRVCLMNTTTTAMRVSWHLTAYFQKGKQGFRQNLRNGCLSFFRNSKPEKLSDNLHHVRFLFWFIVQYKHLVLCTLAKWIKDQHQAAAGWCWTMQKELHGKRALRCQETRQNITQQSSTICVLQIMMSPIDFPKIYLDICDSATFWVYMYSEKKFLCPLLLIP